MSDPYLPAEILDHVVDHLHDTPDALRNCCLVCKSWIPRARMHLFADIRFHTVEDLESWKVTFPDPSTSPMCYAKTLAIDCPSSDAEVGGWIGGFSRVVHLEVRSHRFPGDLVPFYGFSPAIKSLHMIFDVPPPPCAFDLVLSFPLLENLTVKIFFESSASARDFDWPPPATQPSNPPTLTGSLELYLRGGMKHITHRLLSFPGGIHFWKLTLTWCREGDLTLLTALVGECSHTLESLNITCSILVEPGSASIDLSKATKLEDVVFGIKTASIECITASLQTITPKHRDLRQITIYVFSFINASVPQNFGEWMGLDHILVRLQESHSIRLEIAGRAGQDMRYCVGCLLPETAKRGIVNLVEHPLPA